MATARTLRLSSWIGLMMMMMMMMIAKPTVEALDVIHSRSERALVYQSAAVLQLTIGVQAPVILPNRTIAVSIGLQSNFFLPLNITQLNPYYALALAGTAARTIVEEVAGRMEAQGKQEAEDEEKQKAEAERRRRAAGGGGGGDPTLLATYAHLEATLGRACVLRAVCEAAAQPLAPRTHVGEPPGLMEELVHLLLTPSEAGEGVPEAYLRAERRGHLAGDCADAFPSCPSSPLDLVSASVLW
ncbi:hypothetical protein R5R35_011104 [Gryllus longicercus]|uniref:Uncharacterized protein n=1 Tax=Gryllus longicercus TaxID=2509291 RepID=A0AAN9VRS8_9ORTH